MKFTDKRNKIFISFLIILLILNFIQLAYCTTETRYMRGDQQTINGLSAYALGLSQTAVSKVGYRVKSGNWYCEWGIRVWERASSGIETEITSGTPIAIVSRYADAQGLQSATWTCPLTSLIATDAIVVRVYIRIGTTLDTWTIPTTTSTPVFITQQLGATQLDAVTWTVYYYTKRIYLDSNTWAYYYWGTPTYNSRITNFQWSAPTKQWYNAETWKLNLYALKWFASELWKINIHTLKWFSIELWRINLYNFTWNLAETWKLSLYPYSWFLGEVWKIGLHAFSWFNVETWKITLSTIGWYRAEIWKIGLGLISGINWLLIILILLILCIPTFIIWRKKH